MKVLPEEYDLEKDRILAELRVREDDLLPWQKSLLKVIVDETLDLKDTDLRDDPLIFMRNVINNDLHGYEYRSYLENAMSNGISVPEELMARFKNYPL